jgi:hypothetical protein
VGSSSKSDPKKKAAAEPTMAASQNVGGGPDYYTDPSQVPTTGGFVLPTAPPGAIQGAGLNWYVPPPPPTRNTLASTINNNGSFYDSYGRGARGMGGSYGNGSR